LALSSKPCRRSLVVEVDDVTLVVEVDDVTLVLGHRDSSTVE